MCELLAKPLKRLPKSQIRPDGSHFCSARVTLQHNKEFIMCLFFINSFIDVFYWYARHFEYSCKRCSLNDWKQTAQQLKVTKETTNYQQKRQQFSFTKRSIKNPESSSFFLSLSLCFKRVFPLFAFFKDELGEKKIA